MKRVLSSGAGLLLIALAFLAFNMVSGLLFSGARLDLTEQKLYTISPGTKRILAGLDEPINLYFFYSDSGARELVPLRNYARRVEELLRAYEREANGRIRLQVIDPEPFSENEDKATEFGLQGIPLQQGGDNLYFGLAGSNALDGVQVIPFFPLDQEEFLEYDISRLVQTLAQPQRPVVGLMSSLPLNGGFDMASRQPTSPWMVMEEIRQQFDLRSLKSDATEIPPEVSVLLLVHPKQLPEQTLYAIDQFVLRGGKLLAFVDPFSEADSGSDFTATLDGDKSSDLAPLFEAWGAAPAAGQGARRRRLCDVHQSWPGPASGPASGLAQLAARGAGPGRHRHCRPGKPDPGDARHPRKAPRSEHQLHAFAAKLGPGDAVRCLALRPAA